MDILKIKLRRQIDDSYPVIIDQTVFQRIAQDLEKNPLGRKYAVITDSRVVDLYGSKLSAALCERGIDACSLYFKEGEQSKNPEVWLKLTQGLLDMGFNRNDCIIALGGGVAGDMAGFVAATYMRGIPWLQVPTSLLAMADASIGGKVGIDLQSGKNLAGAFWQPKAVYIGLECLKTLPKPHRLNGLAEVVKSSLIKDADLFWMLEAKSGKIFSSDGRLLKQAMIRSLKVKASVVEKDEREISGERKILNYGHTIGHALESLSGFKLLHGFAVAFGMRAAARIAVEMELLSEKDAEIQNELLDSLGFPPVLPRDLGNKIKTRAGREKFFAHLLKDKKASSGGVEMVLLCQIGEVKRDHGSWTMPVGERMVNAGLEEITE